MPENVGGLRYGRSEYLSEKMKADCWMGLTWINLLSGLLWSGSPARLKQTKEILKYPYFKTENGLCLFFLRAILPNGSEKSIPHYVNGPTYVEGDDKGIAKRIIPGLTGLPKYAQYFLGYHVERRKVIINPMDERA